MKIINIKLVDIKPYWRNPRKNDKAIEAVKLSITDYGFNSPLILDKEHVIIAGHTRYKALIEMGWTEAPCVIADITPAKAKEYRIADNKTSELAVWDMDNLIPELREIQSLDLFKPYFPELNLPELLQITAGAGSSNYKEVTEENIAKVEAKMSSEFEDRGLKTDYIEVSCPHCGEASYVARDELMRQPTVAYN
jgi:hypothetical protein